MKDIKAIGIATLLGFVIGVFYITLVSLSQKKEKIFTPKIVKTDVKIPVIDTIITTVTVAPDIYEVKGSHYNAVVAQCDEDPFTTADMSKINVNKLNNGKIRWVALSRDMISRWGGPFDYGDTIYVYHDKPELRGVWYIHDCMNARYKKRIDFLLPLNKNMPGTSRAVLISKQPFIIERHE